MRLTILLTIDLLTSALPAAARDPMIKDGNFTICAFQNFEKCELFTERAITRYRFDAQDKRVLQELKRHAAAQSTTQAALERSFGKASKIFPHRDHPNDTTMAWFHNSVGQNDLNAKCPECGIYVYVSVDLVTSLNYIVDQKFTLAWNRAGAPKPPR